jgi:Lon protease-like protein
VALPLHIFENRYRLMIARCIDRGEPFGVVLVREGSDVGPIDGRIAQIGTTAAIRRAGRYPDGRMDILTVGQRRFHLDSLDTSSEPYLLGRVSLLDEPSGPQPEARDQAERVGRRFLRYLELLQPEGDADGPEIEIEIEIDVDDGGEDAQGAVMEASDETVLSDMTDDISRVGPLVQEMDASGLSIEQRRELLMAAAARLISTDDPTALSYVLTALIQVDLSTRQELLEAADTVARLGRLDSLLTRETLFLQQGLRPIIIDATQQPQRRF